MDQHIPGSSADDSPIDLDQLGKELAIASIGSNMRLLECPKCSKKFIRDNKDQIKFAICTCKVRIKLKRRWYD
jgi:hypothetical protein